MTKIFRILEDGQVVKSRQGISKHYKKFTPKKNTTKDAHASKGIVIFNGVQYRSLNDARKHLNLNSAQVKHYANLRNQGVNNFRIKANEKT